MYRLLRALFEFRNNRDGWAWKNPWVMAAALLVPVSVVLPLARARVSTRRSRNFYSN
jgi:hypothetical protein